MKIRYHRERLRLMSGMKQETKMKVSLLPKRIRRAISNQCSCRNYFYIGEIINCTLYYDGNTQRSLKTERILAKRYGIKFVPAEEETNDETLWQKGNNTTA